MSESVEGVALQLAFRSLEDQIQTLKDLRTTSGAILAGSVAGTGLVLKIEPTVTLEAWALYVVLFLLVLSLAMGVLVPLPAHGWRSRGPASALLAFGQGLPREDLGRFIAAVVTRFDQYFWMNEDVLRSKAILLNLQLGALGGEIVFWFAYALK